MGYLVAALGSKMASEFHPLVAKFEFAWRGPLAMLPGCASTRVRSSEHVKYGRYMVDGTWWTERS